MKPEEQEQQLPTEPPIQEQKQPQQIQEEQGFSLDHTPSILASLAVPKEPKEEESLEKVDAALVLGQRLEQAEQQRQELVPDPPTTPIAEPKDHDPESETWEAPKKEPKKKRLWIRVLLLVLTSLLVLAACGVLLVRQKLGLIQYIPSQWDEKTLGYQSKLFEEDGVVNILLIGTDESGEDFDSTARADSILIASVNLKTNSATLISLERAIAVPIEGVGEDWLTHVFPYGGSQLLVETVSREFDLDLAHYVRVNFSAFEKLVDQIGGVTVTLNQPEITALNPLVNTPLRVGTNRLDGQAALQFGRLRSIDSDFQRVERQRKLLQAAADETGELSLLELNALLDELLPLIETNISPQELATLVLYIPGFSGVQIQQTTVPNDSEQLMGTATPDGRILTQIDFAQASLRIKQMIYTQEGTDEKL